MVAARSGTGRAAVRAAIVGAIGIAALVSPAVAGADPAPGAPIEPAPPPATIGSPLGQSNGGNGSGALRLPDAVGAATLAQSNDPNPGPFGVPNVTDPGSFLAQNPVPMAPGGPPGTPAPVGFDGSTFLGLNEVPSAPGQGSMVGLPPGATGPSNPLEFLGELHQANVSGRLVGIGFGFRSQEQLGEPLPGTAPAPGIPIPPGLGEDLPVPAPKVPPAVPPAG